MSPSEKCGSIQVEFEAMTTFGFVSLSPPLMWCTTKVARSCVCASTIVSNRTSHLLLLLLLLLPMEILP
jgi:hypothetical protein